MKDFKSKLPSLKEVGDIGNKLFKDLKTSVCEIMDDYKQKREEEGRNAEAKTSSQGNPKVEETAPKNSAKSNLNPDEEKIDPSTDPFKKNTKPPQ